MPKNRNSQYKSAINFLFKYIKPHKKYFIITVTASALLIITNMFQTYTTSSLINSSSSRDSLKIVFNLLMFIIITAANIILTWINSSSSAKLSSSSGKDIKLFICNKLLNSNYIEIQKIKSGDLLSTLNTGTSTVCNFINSNLTSMFSQFVMAFAGITYLMIVNPLLCIVTFIYTPIGMFFTLFLNRKLNKLYPENADYRGNALSAAEQALSCIPVIKSFMMEKQILKNIKAKYDDVYETDMKIAFFNALMQPACYTTSCIPRIIYLLCGGYMVMKGSLSIGTFIAIFSLLDYVIGPTVYFPFMLNSLNKAISSINRINRLENLHKEHKETLSSNIIGKPSIKIHDLSFGYNADKYIINHLSFEYSGSGIVALCGKSGSGKTTLFDLISNLHCPQNGKIELCGDICSISQDTYLFCQNVIENIRCARMDASDEEVINAAKKADADSFIKSLSNGYNTVLGDGNSNLSGGQRQRISLARAILKNADIWLLDEPTSALDTQTETFIVDTIRKVSKEKLIIISTHRKTIKDCADITLNLKGAEIQ